ncbi:MAG: hypothetical protein PHV34_24725 [Verrucomicrobiae bacterium]|nr:hypothetical protein [Verrucomicrobiae bacterium]
MKPLDQFWAMLKFESRRLMPLLCMLFFLGAMSLPFSMGRIDETTSDVSLMSFLLTYFVFMASVFPPIKNSSVFSMEEFIFTSAVSRRICYWARIVFVHTLILTLPCAGLAVSFFNPAVVVDCCMTSGKVRTFSEDFQKVFPDVCIKQQDQVKNSDALLRWHVALPKGRIVFCAFWLWLMILSVSISQAVVFSVFQLRWKCWFFVAWLILTVIIRHYFTHKIEAAMRLFIFFASHQNLLLFGALVFMAGVLFYGQHRFLKVDINAANAAS